MAYKLRGLRDMQGNLLPLRTETQARWERAIRATFGEFAPVNDNGPRIEILNLTTFKGL